MHPFFDIHTHRQRQDPTVQSIYNVRLQAKDQLYLDSDWISMGIHPWDLEDDILESQLSFLRDHSSLPQVKMIGECGFDKLRGPELSLQHEAFRQQADIALTIGKPLIIHCVKAFDELLPYGKTYGKKVPLIIHGFNKSKELGKALIRHGFLLSFGSAILKDSSAASLLASLDTPFFLETDDKDVPIEAIYERVAFLRQQSTNMLKDIIFANWKKMEGSSDNLRL